MEDNSKAPYWLLSEIGREMYTAILSGYPQPEEAVLESWKIDLESLDSEDLSPDLIHTIEVIHKWILVLMKAWESEEEIHMLCWGVQMEVFGLAVKIDVRDLTK